MQRLSKAIMTYNAYQQETSIIKVSRDPQVKVQVHWLDFGCFSV
jgi:hypothetical protein